MATFYTEAELGLYANLPETDLVDLAIELDIPVGESISRQELLEAVIPQLADLAAREGLPFSRFDLEDLQALPREHLAALARVLRVSPEPGAIVKAGEKLYRTYQNKRQRSQIPLVVPMMLPTLARFLATGRHASG